MRQVPKQQRSEKLINKIFNSTHEWIQSRPLKQFSTNSLAKNAGISVGSIYRYFDDKNDLLIGLYKYLNKRTDRIFSESEEKFKHENQNLKHLSPTERDKALNEALDKYFQYFMQYKKHILLFSKAIWRLGAHKVVLKSRHQSALKLKNVLEEYYLIDKNKSYIMSYVIVTAFIGTIHNYLLEGDASGQGPEELKAHLKKMILTYILSESQD